MKGPFAQVLTVDHNAIIALEMQQLLQPLGIALTIAPSGEAALELVQQRRFDLVILSHHLPGMCGLEVCRRLNLNPGLKDIPVIFVSGEYDQHFKDDAARLGVVDYLTKPFEEADFQARVLAHLPKPAYTDDGAETGSPAKEP